MRQKVTLVQAFVIEFNRRTRTRRVRELDDARAAIQYRLQREGERSDPDVEIVALTSTSLESLQRTHSRYFTGEDIGEVAPAQ